MRIISTHFLTAAAGRLQHVRKEPRSVCAAGQTGDNYATKPELRSAELSRDVTALPALLMSPKQSPFCYNVVVYMNPTWRWLQSNGASLNLTYANGPSLATSILAAETSCDLWFDKAHVNLYVWAQCGSHVTGWATCHLTRLTRLLRCPQWWMRISYLPHSRCLNLRLQQRLRPVINL